MSYIHKIRNIYIVAFVVCVYVLLYIESILHKKFTRETIQRYRKTEKEKPTSEISTVCVFFLLSFTLTYCLRAHVCTLIYQFINTHMYILYINYILLHRHRQKAYLKTVAGLFAIPNCARQWKFTPDTIFTNST